MTNESYLENPCRMSSIPLWKTRVMFLPDSIKIVHDADFDESMLKHYIDEPYFRLKHTLQNLTSFALPVQCLLRSMPRILTIAMKICISRQMNCKCIKSILFTARIYGLLLKMIEPEGSLLRELEN